MSSWEPDSSVVGFGRNAVYGCPRVAEQISWHAYIPAFVPNSELRYPLPSHRSLGILGCIGHVMVCVGG